MSSDIDYLDGHVTNARTTVVQYLREVPIVSIEDYFNCFMPPLPGSLELDEIVRRLSEPLVAGLELAPLDLSTSGSPFWRWYRDSPKKQTDNESKVFSYFANISQAVTSTCVTLDESLRPTSRLRCLSEVELKGDLQSSSQPDAIHVGTDLGEFLVEEEREHNRLWWDHAAVLYEFKKGNSDTDVFDDMWRMTWSMVQKLRTDPACRFVRGCTIEDTGTRFWYADHSVMTVTEPINFNRDHRIMASFFARLAFASSSQLGRDSSITRLSSTAFKIRVSGRTYTTTRYLRNASADKVFRRCARVWEAFDCVTEQTICIKDYWLDDDRPSESELLHTILSAIAAYSWEAVASEDPRPELSVEERQAYFVRILASDIVQVDGSEDNTRRMRNRYAFTSDQKQLALAYFKPTEREQSTIEGRISDGDYTFQEVTAPFHPGSVASKTHHRVLMERGKDLYAVKKSPDVFIVCADAAYALFILRCLNWGHRDISPGNILAFPTSEGGVRGVLVDFEYSKRLDDTSPIHPLRTGTPSFMAVEVQYGDFGYFEPPVVDVRTENRAQAPKPVWTFCAAHDLESLWWLLLWMIFRHYVRSPQLPGDPPSRPLDAESRLHRQIYHQLFSGPFNNSSGTRHTFLVGTRRQQVAEALERYWPSELLQAVCGDLPHGILQVYVEAQGARTTPSQLYKDFIAACDKAAELEGDLEKIPFI